MRSNRSRFSSTGRLRNGLSLPPAVSVPRCLADLLGGLVVHVRLALADQLDGVLVHRVEVVRRPELAGPLEAEPADVFLDRADVFLFFLGGVGVVVAEVAGAVVFLGDAEVQADALGVADVQVAVGLRREARGDAAAPLAGAVVLFDDPADEVQADWCGLLGLLWLASGSRARRLGLVRLTGVSCGILPVDLIHGRLFHQTYLFNRSHASANHRCGSSSAIPHLNRVDAGLSPTVGC